MDRHKTGDRHRPRDRRLEQRARRAAAREDQGKMNNEIPVQSLNLLY